MRNFLAFRTYKNQSIDLYCTIIDWSLYNGNIGVKIKYINAYTESLLLSLYYPYSVAFEGELTRFQRSLDFYTLLKHRKTCSFLMFKGGIKVEHGLKMSWLLGLMIAALLVLIVSRLFLS